MEVYSIGSKYKSFSKKMAARLKISGSSNSVGNLLQNIKICTIDEMPER